jgi:hypothetical protein
MGASRSFGAEGGSTADTVGACRGAADARWARSALEPAWPIRHNKTTNPIVAAKTAAAVANHLLFIASSFLANPKGLGDPLGL